MTVESDIQKALAGAQVALGSYSNFAQSTDDKSAQQMFKDMAQDMQRHVSMLNTRLDYLKSNNPMNQPPKGQGGQQQ